MSSDAPPSREAFEQQVRDCLLHFYDYVYLQDHQLLKWIVPDAGGANRVQNFRQVVTETIEQMRPAPDIDFHSKEARYYNILTLRYLERQQAQEVPQQLALSDRQFYREHAKAIEMLSWLLWEHLTGAPSPEMVSPETVHVSVQSEVQRLQHSEITGVDLSSLLAGVYSTLDGIASQHDVNLILDTVPDVPPVQADPTILRQVVIWMLAQVIKGIPEGSQVTVSYEVTEAYYQINLLLGNIGEALALADLYGQHDTISYLINTLHGRLIYQEPQHVILHVPRHQAILVIDDNPDIITLFERYLTGHAAHILAAHTAEQALEIARQSQPILIVLDVMLPGHDGWEILQNLRSHPTTQHIPVLVCSVLDVPDLARMFGAEGFLKKPPGQAEFLDLIARWHI